MIAAASDPLPHHDALLAEAERSIARGWVLTPLSGKKPIEPAWQKRKGTTMDEVRVWLTIGYQRADRTRVRVDNVGLVCGPASGVFVLDFDTPSFDEDLAKAKTAEERAAIDAERTRHVALRDSLPPTICVESGGGGRHYYFKWQPGLGCSRGALPRHVDAKGEGGQVVLPGSIHPKTGRPYVWVCAP